MYYDQIGVMGTPISKHLQFACIGNVQNPSEQLFRIIHLTVAIPTIHYYKMLDFTPLASLHPVPGAIISSALPFQPLDTTVLHMYEVTTLLSTHK